MTEFRGFTLDRFQQEAVDEIEKGRSVVVSAATGTGKTLIADYVIDKHLKQDDEIIYTAPIKALSNQKFKDFKKRYGEENVGLLTGDVSINEDAPLRIMTTEIYRNMLLTQETGLEDLAYVIFDEVHYLGDPHRGKVWEESFIFSGDNVRFLCLSATIPNAHEFAEWIQRIKHHEITVVEENERAVPLHHMFYDLHRGFGEIKDLKKWKKHKDVPNYNKAKGNKGKYYANLKKKRKKQHITLIENLRQKGWLPTIYFCFSRRKTQNKSKVLSKSMDLLTQEERANVQRVIQKKLEEADESVKKLRTTSTLRKCLVKGTGFHHAGLVPTHKDIVETLFEKGLVKALFCTETFAVGINMPAKTVCFDSLEKYDGTGFRYLNGKEYFQLAGRAGRRGLDDVGYSICVVESKFADVNRIRNLISGERKPLKSQFTLTYNTVLNLLYRYKEQEREKILQSSFFTYQKGTEKTQIQKSFSKKVEELIELGYVEKDINLYELTEKGLFAMNIYHHEIHFSELFAQHTYDFTEKEILLSVATILFEERKNRNFTSKHGQVSNKICKKVKDNSFLEEYFSENKPHKLETFFRKWYDGCEFADLVEYTTMSEGDIVRFFRMVLDGLHQIKHATLNDELYEKIERVEERIDRDIISVSL